MNMPEQPLCLHVIARVQSEFAEKFGVPRQSGLVPQTQARVVFEREYRSEEAVRELEGFSHLWLLWEFSKSPRGAWSPTVRPPRLGGNRRVGVFASRSPFRPNPIGLSCVRLERVEHHPKLGPVLHILGADLVDDTPIYDIKPYLISADCHPDAVCGYAEETQEHCLHVDIPPQLLQGIPAATQQALCGILAQDPRPGYQHDDTRVYKLSFAGLSVHFTVQGDHLVVSEILPL